MHKYLEALQEQLPNEAIKLFLEPNPSLCVAIKTQKNGYVFGNQAYLSLMGYSSLREFLHITDADLCADKKTLAFIENDDEKLYDTGQALSLSGDIRPIRHPYLIKPMVGTAYPLHVTSSRPDAIVLVCEPKNKLITLSLELLVKTDVNQLQTILTRSSYPINSPLGLMRLSRSEILCFAETLKGKHAGEIADQLMIKQITVESYLSHLKNKCGVNKKSDLIDFLITNHIFEKIIV